MKRRFVRSFAGLVTFLAMTPALAVTEAYLSSTGSGSACTLAAPCSSIQAAVVAAGVGGEVICLNKGAYGSNITFPINQSVTISCGDGLLEAPHGQIDINGPAGSNIVIEGLVIDGETSGCCSIRYTGQGTLDLRHVRSGNMTGVASDGLGYAPSGNATLIVSNSIFYNNGGQGIRVAPTAGTTNVTISNTIISKSGGIGLRVQPTGTVAVRIIIDGLTAVGNAAGVFTTTTGAGNSVQTEIRNSNISGNAGFGVYSRSLDNGSSSIVIENSSVSNNASVGIRSEGAKSRVLLSRSTVTGNNLGLQLLSGGALLTYGNNALSNIAPGSAPSGTISTQ